MYKLNSININYFVKIIPQVCEKHINYYNFYEIH